MNEPRTTAIRVIGIDHVVLRCADVEASLTFYTHILGLQPERLDEWRRGEVPFPSVRINPTLIIDLFPEPPTGANFDHICLTIEPTGIDTLISTFPNSRRNDHFFGAQGYTSSVYITDPDGNTVELRSYDSQG